VTTHCVYDRHILLLQPPTFSWYKLRVLNVDYHPQLVDLSSYIDILTNTLSKRHFCTVFPLPSIARVIIWRWMRWMAGDKKCIQIFGCTIIMEETAVQSEVQVGG